MKRFVSLLLVLALLLSVTACGDNSAPEVDATNAIESESGAVIETETTTEIEPAIVTEASTEPVVQLSSQCTEILCSAYDGEDYYELVYNVIEKYPNAERQFGVIKNNKWLVDLTDDFPFINENGKWKFTGYTSEHAPFNYIGGGCFLYGSNSGIIYNPDSGIWFETVSLVGRSAYHDFYDTRYSEMVNEKSEIICFDKDYCLTYFNLNTGDSKRLDWDFLEEISVTAIGSFSDGLVFMRTKDDTVLYGDTKEGFYDLDGSMVVDLSDYYISDYRDYKYENGKYVVVCPNDHGAEFELTLDLTGKVVSQEKVIN